jgi:hypothetical protein
MRTALQLEKKVAGGEALTIEGCFRDRGS